VRNSGEVTAEITAASLTFTLGNLTQSISAPNLPQYLPGNNATASIKFKVGVDLLSPMGLSEFSCNILSRDTNIPTSISWLNLTTPSDSWIISQHGLTTSAFPSYTPNQGTFNRGQTFYTRGFFQTPGQQGRIRFYDTQISYATPAPAGWVAVSGLLTADAAGNLSTAYTLSPTANLGTWTALVENNIGTVLAINHFSVQAMGNLVASLTLYPSQIYLGGSFTAELSVKNEIPGGSTISPAVPWSLMPTLNSTGSAILLSGPTPAQGSISGFSPGTFTWVFQAVEDTGDVGSYSLTASFTSLQTYRTPLAISNATSLTNHQVRLTMNTAALVGAGKMRADCADIRFRDSDSQTELPYWLESGANTANTVLWVKVPAIMANIPKIIYCYYGNPAAVTSSNGKAVFEFFDHFTSLNPTVWDRTGTNSVTGTNLTITTGAVISRTPVSSQPEMAVEASLRWNNFAGFSGLAISNFQNDKINNNPGAHRLVNLMTPVATAFMPGQPMEQWPHTI